MAKKRVHADKTNDFDDWAKYLLAAIGKVEARKVLAQYRTIARNPEATDYDRSVARQQAKALSRLK